MRASGRPRARLLAVLIGALAASPVVSQSIICCNQSIGVGGDWVGSGRVDDCQGYFNSAAPDILRRMCEQRQYLSCIDTSRCSELPPGEAGAQEPGEGEPWPPDVDRDGIGQAFYGPAPDPPAVPATPPAPPRRLVYIVKLEPTDGGPSAQFTVWLDRAGCPLPLDRQANPIDPAAAARILRGALTRGDGGVRVEATAQAGPDSPTAGSFAAEAVGEDAGAVTQAMRGVLRQLGIACR